MNKFFSLFSLLMLVQPSFAEECKSLPEKAERFIKSYTEKARGAEYCEFRLITRGDVDSDGIQDLIVVFNIEGACGKDKTTAPGACGNNVETYLKIFLGKELKEVPVLMVGGRGGRLITDLKIVNGVIQAETLSYGKDDPMCCPSIKGKTEFVLNKDSLTEKRL